MYVCLCQAVTDKDIRRAAANGAGSLHELQQSLGVAMGCGSCADHAEAILVEAHSDSRPPSPVMYIPSVA
jgi:bacterioferritin-associated ferredoxin